MADEVNIINTIKQGVRVAIKPTNKPVQSILLGPGESLPNATYPAAIEESHVVAHTRELARNGYIKIVPVQVATLSFEEVASSALVGSGEQQIGVKLVTSDGLPLRETATVEVYDNGTGTAIGDVDYVYDPNPKTVTFNPDDESGTVKVVSIEVVAPSEAVLVANAGILLWLNPEDDSLFVDAGVTPVNKAGGSQNAVRWVPGVKPDTLAYLEDAGADYPLWLPGASGINGHPVVHYTGTQALHVDVDGTGTFRTSDLFDASSGVFVFTGKRTGTDAATSIKVIQDGFANAMYLEMLSSGAGGGTRLVMDMASDVTLNTPPDGNGVLSFVAWLHGTTVDWWLNGVKQTAVTGVGTLSNLTRLEWSIRNFFGTTFMLLRHGAGKAAGATEADMATLAAYLEALVGR